MGGLRYSSLQTRQNLNLRWRSGPARDYTGELRVPNLPGNGSAWHNGMGGECVETEAVFEFVAENPPSLMIAGGVLMYLVGSFQHLAGGGGGELLGPAPWLVGGGVVLQILWLLLM